MALNRDFQRYITDNFDELLDTLSIRGSKLGLTYTEMVENLRAWDLDDAFQEWVELGDEPWE